MKFSYQLFDNKRKGQRNKKQTQNQHFHRFSRAGYFGYQNITLKRKNVRGKKC